jgi:PAS domain S-box-containing protein
MGEHPDFFRDLCDNAHDLIQSVAPDGRYLYANKAWHETLGYTVEDLESIRLFDVIHPACRDHCAAAFRDLLAGKPSVELDAIFKAKDGRRVEVEGSASCRFEDGRPVATRGIFRDVTERNKARDQLERLFDLSLDLLCVAGVDGYFKQINPAFERVLGYSREELLSRSFLEFVHPEDQAGTLKEIKRLAEGLPVVDFQNRYLTKSGTYRWLAWRSAPLPERGLIYAVARDITESKRIETLMRRQAAELERSNADLEQYASTVAHDLKAPLRAIANLSDWIEEDMPGDLPEKVKGHLEKLQGRVERLDSLTEDLLEYSRAGRGEEAIRKVDTTILVGDLVQVLAPPRQFEVRVEQSLPRFVTAKAPLEQVLGNLIGNAVKHHHRRDGKVTVSARDLGDLYEFTVSDDGPGIPSEDQERVFQMFHRLRPGEEAEGTGMGLALVRRIVERHGGRVRVASGNGRGAKFVFTWPKRIRIAGEEDAEDPDRR